MMQIFRSWTRAGGRRTLRFTGMVLACWALQAGAQGPGDAYIPWGHAAHLGTNDDIVSTNFPLWFGSAFRTGAGGWDTNIPAWSVAAGETNEAALEMLFNRALLTNSLMVNLGYRDHSNATLALDALLLADQAVTASNLVGNLLTGSGIDTTRTVLVPLIDMNLVGLQLRRGTGTVMVRDTLLAPDSDGDGYSDVEEFLLGSDASSALSVPGATVSGLVTYAGAQSGVVYVIAPTNGADWASANQVSLAIPPSASMASFNLSGLPLRHTYYARAWRDANGNLARESWEPCGVATPYNLFLAGSTGVVTIAMGDPDSDGDGISDIDEMLLGRNPGSFDNYGGLPFIENFETNTVQAGELNGQNGWMASPAGAASVQSAVVCQGARALAISTTNEARVTQLLVATNAPEVWVDTYIRAYAASAPTNLEACSGVAYLESDGYLRVYDGPLSAPGGWVSLTNMPACMVTGEWIRLTFKLDYRTQRWLVCLNGLLAASELGFASPVERFNMFSCKAQGGGMDALSVTTGEPAGISVDGDQMPDDWERSNFGNTDLVDSGDADGDGLSNRQEYLAGTDPNNADSDQDGMSDGWELAHGLNPLGAADASLDTDGDGLSNLAEFGLGTDPQVADTDHDGLSDGVEVNTWQSNPLSGDTDGDGFNDGDEVAHGTSPSDAATFPGSAWQKHLRLTVREDACTNALADVPVLVRLTSERIDYSRCASDGHDLYFMDSAGSPLNFEVEQWNTNGDSLIWVRLPEVGNTNSANHFWLHSGYAEATNAANAAAVWSTNVLGVWHLAGTNTVQLDSAPGQHAATNSGAVCVPGILGDALDFRGSDSVIVPPAALDGLSNAVTISFWQYGETNQPVNRTCLGGTSVVGLEINVLVPWGNGNVYWDAFGNYDRICKAATNTLYKGGWNYWTFTKDRISGVMHIYVNGELWHSGTGKTRSYTPVTSLRIGSAANGTSGYMGMMDEVRIESVAQDPAWVRLQYKSMRDEVLIYGEQQVAIFGMADGSEPDQAGSFLVTRTATDHTNMSLTVNLSVGGGSAVEGSDFALLPRSVVIPAGSMEATLQVPALDDLWLEGAEPATVSLAKGDYFIDPAQSAASINILDNDVDTDMDGICDEWEMQKFSSLEATSVSDADSDGVTDLQEYQLGTNPGSTDTDGDGLPDAWEIAMGTNPLVPDAGADPDHDGLTNLQEYQLGTNPVSSDGDGDGMPDNWESANGLNPMVSDAALDPDQDGLSNLKEYQKGCKPLDSDTDGDGLSDGSEVNTCKTSPVRADTDGDGMPDKWEVDNGTNPLVKDSAADPDGDNLTNMQERQNGTNPKVADSDEDGMADGAEVFAHTDPLVRDFDGTSADIMTINGADAVSSIGTWTTDGEVIYAGERSGSLDYSIHVPSNGNYVLVVQITQHNALTSQNTFDLGVAVDGVASGRQIVRASYGVNNTALFFLPELMAGDRLIRLRWFNSSPNTFLQVNSLVLRSYGGVDANTNGIPDWLDKRSTWLFEFSPPAQSSLVSPVCLEGASVYQDWLSVTSPFVPDGQTQQVIAVRHAVGDGWFADVMLSPSNATEIVVNDAGTGTVQTNLVTWETLNLCGNNCGTNMAIRCGSALQFAGWPVDVTNGVVSITIRDSGNNAVTNLYADVGSAIPCAFNQAGTFEVESVYSGELTVTNAVLPVKVLSGNFNGSDIACVVNQTRTWDCPGLATDIVVEADGQIAVTRTHLAGGGSRFTLLNATDVGGYMVARIGPDGPILDSAKISAILADHGTYMRVVETFADGSRMTEIRLQLGYVPADLVVDLHIFAGGVTFLDGTLNKTLTAADFNELGVCTYRMLQSATSMSSTCHTTKLYQGGLYIGGN